MRGGQALRRDQHHVAELRGDLQGDRPRGQHRAIAGLQRPDERRDLARGEARGEIRRDGPDVVHDRVLLGGEHDDGGVAADEAHHAFDDRRLRRLDLDVEGGVGELRQHLGESRDANALTAKGERSAAVRREAIPGVDARERRARARADRAARVGGAIEGRVVQHHDLAVGGRVHVELEDVRSVGAGLTEGDQRVLGGYPGGAAVTEETRLPPRESAASLSSRRTKPPWSGPAPTPRATRATTTLCRPRDWPIARAGRPGAPRSALVGRRSAPRRRRS